MYLDNINNHHSSLNPRALKRFRLLGNEGVAGMREESLGIQESVRVSRVLDLRGCQGLSGFSGFQDLGVIMRGISDHNIS